MFSTGRENTNRSLSGSPRELPEIANLSNMKPSGDSNVFIDLSYLSPEEETVIQKVLLRDEDLKRLDTGRVRRLKDSVPDPQQLKVLSGEWFEELKLTRYGYQPHASAVVRSSMRWKKTTGHKPNPFTIPVLEDGDAETAETHPGVPVDPRSIHPALSVEVCQEIRDEDVVLKVEDAPGLKLNEERRESGAKPEDEPSFTLSGVVRSETNSEERRSSPKQDYQTNVFIETRTPEFKKKHVEGGRNFEIRSFNEALTASAWYQSRRLDAEALPNNTSPEAEPNKTGRASPTTIEELNLYLNAKEDPDVLPDLQTGSVHNPTTPKQESLDQSVVDPVKKERSVTKITIADFRQASQELPGGLHGGEDGGELRLVSHTEKVKTPKEIAATEFRGASPTRTDLNLDTLVENVEAYDLNHPEDVRFDRTILSVETERGQIAKSAVNSKAPGRTMDHDATFIDSVGADQQTSPSNETEGESDVPIEESSTDSEILTSVYERAVRPKLMDEEDPIPTILIASESEGPEETESLKKGISSPEAPAEGRSRANGDTWEGVSDSGSDGESSASSRESDLLGKKSLSASRLSVTERTGSLLSVYSDAGDFGDVMVQGSVEFAIMYSPLGELVIMVEQCQDLAVANLRKQRTDPYVKTYLYPDKRSKRKTSIKKNNVNPVFVETLRYKVKHEDLPGRTLNLSVWHNDPRGRNVFLGQVEISLRNWDWGHEALTWYALQPKSKDSQEPEEPSGVLSVALKYVPPESPGGSRLSGATGEIHIWLREARQLRRLKAQGVDSFVKCYMLPDTSKKSRHKTRVVKRSQDPVFNHTMVYDGFRTAEIGEACCELTVWDSNKLSNQFLGGVRLGLGTGLSYGKKVDWMDSENEEKETWKRML